MYGVWSFKQNRGEKFDTTFRFKNMLESMSLERFKYNIEYAKSTGLNTFISGEQNGGII